MCMVRLMIRVQRSLSIENKFVHIDDESIIHLVRPLMDKVGIHKNQDRALPVCQRYHYFGSSQTDDFRYPSAL